MNETLFPISSAEDGYIDFHYTGSSFEGHIEIDKLAAELEGLNQALKIALNGLLLHKRTKVTLSDIVIYVEPLENGSFRKRVRIIVKHLNKNSPAYLVVITACALFIQSMDFIKNNPEAEILAMKPSLQADLGDALKVELLQNKDFIKGLAAAIQPLAQEDDKLILSTSSEQNIVELGVEEKLKFEALTAEEEEAADHTEQEYWVGRVTSVDLDATINHFGFKIDNKGATIKCTLVNDLDQETKKSLLGRWVAIKGITSFNGEKRIKIDVLEIKTSDSPEQKQKKIELE